MPSTKKNRKKAGQRPIQARAVKTVLKVGDIVMVIAGGHSTKRPNKGQTGKILRFSGKNRDRVIVEGLNKIFKHKRQTSMNDKAEKIQVEAGIHISNVRYYAEKLKKPVALKVKQLADGKKVRGYMDPESKQFVQI
jgi:large subunit ribosomal protein L24